MSQRILIVEDEVKLAELLRDYLVRDGFAVEILLEGTDAVEIILARKPALVLLDLMLPGMGGLEICKQVRKTSEVPIIMVTARVEEVDRLIGLELGADDYVCKPFSLREVVARVKTVLRRTQTPVSTHVTGNLTSYRGLTLDLGRLTCTFEGERIELTPVEFRLLQAMLEHPGFVFTRDRLMSRCYEDQRVVSDRTIDSHVKNLRRKLGGGTEELIHSIYGVGYKLE